MDCLFCQIIDNQIPADKVFEDGQVLAFRDINPQAPTHILIIPKKHLASLNDLTADDTELAGHLIQTAKKLAFDGGFSDNGYRLVINTHAQGGQDVFHIHLHLLAERQMTWPPG